MSINSSLKSLELSPRCDIVARMCKVAILACSRRWSFAAAPAEAQEGGDLQAQIVYAYHVEDTNLLANLVQTLSTQVKLGRRRSGAALSPGACAVPIRAAGGGAAAEGRGGGL